ncbi:MAG: tetraacyldisaccharide 4'-kinase [Alteromonadaceae bacterium]|nr:tetraacyldisaccharide 4'-kinase [Alteromonadaceae bacterium]
MRLIEQIWFNDPKINKHTAIAIKLLLLPFSLLFWLLSAIRRKSYQLGLLKSIKLDAPVIVVGNISVGGNGKTPMVLWLIEQCRLLGLTAGVISRGYGGKAKHYPLVVDNNTTPAQAGDEAVMIYQRTGVAVAVGSDRIASAQQLISKGCDIIISDDGLQHYRLARELELVIVDGKRGFGNGILMPAGPLREGLWRLKTVDHLIINGEHKSQQISSLAKKNSRLITMKLATNDVVNIVSGERLNLSVFFRQHPCVNAIAGIGSPQRFFDTLLANKFNLNKQQAFVDHYAYQTQDFSGFSAIIPLLMTEKDAVKCQQFAKDNWWYVPVDTNFDDEQIMPLLRQIIKISSENK